ncbi:hypothetical protein HJC23_002540 [Cyclotella cryptica]|uniref:Uncharacterized protein n=1 Tax=Cyclotella cryptica TaxID=29204 RepID=A0ABD3QY76_9STRA|eukprot:CCRYP_001387-RA/>CCRYP_001387-RA protein AED:0.32 eAED:0.32 QI:198/1/1/1/0.33/0.25/4/718/246
MKILPLLKVLVSAMSLASLRPCSSYSIITPRVHSRRKAFESLASSATTVAITLSCSARIAHAKEAPATQSDVTILQEATEALSSLLENWERATIDCTYADVPRELLEAKNKEKFLEKASEFALFDKSTSVVSCKRTNRIVRDYIGATGKGPLVGAEKRLLKNNVVEKVDPDSVDEYFSAVESFSQALSRATSLSYTAGVSDFDSVNNFAKGDNTSLSGDGSNLEQARKAIEEANSFLKRAISLFRA